MNINNIFINPLDIQRQAYPVLYTFTLQPSINVELQTVGKINRLQVISNIKLYWHYDKMQTHSRSKGLNPPTLRVDQATMVVGRQHH